MSQITVLDMVKAHDGAGSGLDADLVQGVPKNLLGIGGDGYSWHDETSNRSAGTTYTNTTGKPIMVNIFSNQGNNCTVSIEVFIDGVSVPLAADNSSDYPQCGGNVIVPAGSTYKVAIYNASVNKWLELK